MNQIRSEVLENFPVNEQHYGLDTIASLKLGVFDFPLNY